MHVVLFFHLHVVFLSVTRVLSLCPNCFSTSSHQFFIKMAAQMSPSSTPNCLLSILSYAGITSPLLKLCSNVQTPFLETWSKHRPLHNQSFQHLEGVTKNPNGFFSLPNMNFSDPKKLIDSVARSIIEYKGYKYTKMDYEILSAIICQLCEELNDNCGLWGNVSFVLIKTV